MSHKNVQRVPQIVAHRGASSQAPENTQSSIELAWKQAADAVEIDVRLTRDRQIVAIHDADTNRTSDRALVVAETDYHALARIDVGSWKEAAYRGERVPQLRAILASLPKAKKLLIELKCGEEILDPLCRELTRCEDRQDRLVIIGFDASLVSEVKKKNPAISALLCVRAPKAPQKKWSTAVIDQLIESAHRLQLDGVDLDAGAPIDRSAVAQLHAANLSCYFWTVDDSRQAAALMQCGVDGLTTNRPGWLREQLQQDNKTSPQAT